MTPYINSYIVCTVWLDIHLCVCTCIGMSVCVCLLPFHISRNSSVRQQQQHIITNSTNHNNNNSNKINNYNYNCNSSGGKAHNIDDKTRSRSSWCDKTCCCCSRWLSLSAAVLPWCCRWSYLRAFHPLHFSTRSLSTHCPIVQRACACVCAHEYHMK